MRILPDELLAHVASFLSLVDLVRLASCCTWLQRVLYFASGLWRTIEIASMEIIPMSTWIVRRPTTII
jgi:hypothetical protein